MKPYSLHEIQPLDHSDEYTMSQLREKIRFQHTDRASARGLRRLGTPGTVLRIGRRAALAELWMDDQGHPLARCSTARKRHWFTLESAGSVDWDSVTREQWDDLLSDQLYRWFVEVLDDEDE